jgi:FkbM family methyltransferase
VTENQRSCYDRYVTTPWGDTIRYSSADYSVGAEFATTGVIFPYELDVLASTITKGGVIFDIGANNGYLTCYFAHLVGPRGYVYATEPASQEFDVLNENVDVNKYANVTCSRFLIGDRAGIGRLWLSGTNLGRHSLYSANVAGSTGSEVVPMITADQYVEMAVTELRSVDMVKVDVEGAECFVLRGASQLLQRTRHVWIEVWQAGIESAGCDPLEIIETLKRHGFSLTAHNIVDRTSHPLDTRHSPLYLTDVMHDSPIVYLHGSRPIKG